MRILHVVESFAGGVLDFLEDLTTMMPEDEHLIFHGVRPDTPSDFKERFGSNCSFIEWRHAQREINFFKDIAATYSLLRFMKKGLFDVIHLHSSKAGFSGRLVARLLGLNMRVIYTPHGVSFLRKDVSRLTKGLYVLLERLGAYLGGRIIACSKCEAEEFRRHGIKAEFIYNGVGCINREPLQRMDDSYVTVATMGRITVQKNPELFARIAGFFKKTRNIRFLWIGDGEERFRQILKANGVNVTGWLKRCDADELLKKADIYLSTSLWEAIPLSVIKAMCYSLPLVLSSYACHRDCVVSGENGFLFDSFEDAVYYIESLINNRVLRLKMGRSSWSYYKELFTLSKMVDSYKMEYLRILNK